MNLLVTNTRNSQAYAIIRALRPYANKIVATMEGDNRFFDWFSHAARSRLVDKRYFTPSPAADWKAGRIQRENTEKEKRYVQAILRICEEEEIDTIFPSYDPHVYVLSKNKESFKKLGILIPVPDFDVVITPLDKYRTVKAAEKVGFPCPKTRLPESEDDLERIADEIGFPLLIKPRFTASGRGTTAVRDFSELSETIRLIVKSCGMPLLQEFIPGDQGDYITLLLDRRGELKMVYQKRFLLYFRRGTFAKYRESITPTGYGIQASRLLKDLGWWGSSQVEVKIDARDNTPKLMEINPRFGSGLMEIVALGINAPWMCLKVARGEEVKSVLNYPVAIHLRPVEDALLLMLQLSSLVISKYQTVVRGKLLFDPFNAPTTFKELVWWYKGIYTNDKEKVFDFTFKDFFQDPVVSVMAWCQFVARVLQSV
jgi:biotin carboxylase